MAVSVLVVRPWRHSIGHCCRKTAAKAGDTVLSAHCEWSGSAHTAGSTRPLQYGVVEVFVDEVVSVVVVVVVVVVLVVVVVVVIVVVDVVVVVVVVEVVVVVVVIDVVVVVVVVVVLVVHTQASHSTGHASRNAAATNPKNASEFDPVHMCCLLTVHVAGSGRPLHNFVVISDD